MPQQNTEGTLQYRLIASPFGHLALLWRNTGDGPRVVRILIPLPGRSAVQRLSDYADAAPGDHPEIEELCAQISRFASGEAIELPIELLDRQACSPFQWQVLMADRATPRGQVRTYGQLAEAVGSPGAARAVGSALARNPFPIVIPCHRAIRADGSLGGYQGGLEMKRRLLEMEGVHLDARGRIVAQR